MERLKRKGEFEQTFKKGRRYKNSYVRLSYYPCVTNTEMKVAVVAAKRLGNAVLRNRCKRLIRSALQQLHVSNVSAKCIFFATEKTASISALDLTSSIALLLQQATKKGDKYENNTKSLRTTY